MASIMWGHCVSQSQRCRRVYSERVDRPLRGREDRPAHRYSSPSLPNGNYDCELRTRQCVVSTNRCCCYRDSNEVNPSATMWAGTEISYRSTDWQACDQQHRHHNYSIIILGRAIWKSSEYSTVQRTSICNYLS